MGRNVEHAYGTWHNLSNLPSLPESFKFSLVPFKPNEIGIVMSRVFSIMLLRNGPIHYNSQCRELAQSFTEGCWNVMQNNRRHNCPTGLRSIVNQKYVNLLINWTGLEIASQLGLFHIVEDFLNEGTNVNSVNDGGGYYRRTPR